MSQVLTEQEVVDCLSAYIQAQGSQRKAAMHMGVSQQFLSEIITKRRPLSDSIAEKLGYKRKVRFEAIDAEPC